jgi:hypothetical protein
MSCCPEITFITVVAKQHRDGNRPLDLSPASLPSSKSLSLKLSFVNSVSRHGPQFRGCIQKIIQPDLGRKKNALEDSWITTDLTKGYVTSLRKKKQWTNDVENTATVASGKIYRPLLQTQPPREISAMGANWTLDPKATAKIISYCLFIWDSPLWTQGPG